VRKRREPCRRRCTHAGKAESGCELVAQIMGVIGPKDAHTAHGNGGVPVGLLVVSGGELLLTNSEVYRC
jgi:hypothetical protein